MFNHIFLRFRRTPLPALGVLLFSAVLAAVLCGLNASNEVELARWEEIFQTLPVKLTVTNLKGTKTDGLAIYSWYGEAFTGGYGGERNDLSDYVKDVQRKASRSLHRAGGAAGYTLTGTSSLELCRELWPENGGAIRWAQGYDETCLDGNEMVCLIPSGLDSREDPGTVTVYLTEDQFFDFTVVGTVLSGADKTLYCPFLALKDCLDETDADYDLDAMCATLKDNARLAEFREAMRSWFIEPDPSGMAITMPGSEYNAYHFALDINDSQLRAASETLENSLLINRICTLLVFVLSAGAGFFVGFLMIRSRKREIALMRTIGQANSQVYMSFALEQMLCVLLGAVLGGGYFCWRPVGQLALFTLIYFAGLSGALMVFLRANLLTVMKEDE